MIVGIDRREVPAVDPSLVSHDATLRGGEGRIRTPAQDAPPVAQRSRGSRCLRSDRDRPDVAGGGARRRGMGQTGRMRGPLTESAPAKLTLSLRVTGVRDRTGCTSSLAEMVTIDLADALTFSAGIRADGDRRGGGGPRPRGPDATTTWWRRRSALSAGVPRSGWPSGYRSARASAAARRMPLRYSGGQGSRARELAAQLGSDVPFCLVGGRARVSGIGESVEAAPVRGPSVRSAVAADLGGHRGCLQGLGLPRTAEDGPAGSTDRLGNDLEEAALSVAPQLLHWRETFAGDNGQPTASGR